MPFTQSLADNEFYPDLSHHLPKQNSLTAYSKKLSCRADVQLMITRLPSTSTFLTSQLRRTKLTARPPTPVACSVLACLLQAGRNLYAAGQKVKAKPFGLTAFGLDFSACCRQVASRRSTPHHLPHPISFGIQERSKAIFPEKRPTQKSIYQPKQKRRCIMNQLRPLTENDLRTLAPSVFASGSCFTTASHQ